MAVGEARRHLRPQRAVDEQSVDEDDRRAGALVSVSNLALRKLDRAAEESNRAPELLIQVDLAGETTKFGVPPGEVPRLFDAAAACRAARIVGLMTLPPIPDTPEEARPWFRRLRALRDEWLAAGVPASRLVVGVPFYGRAWAMASADRRGLYAPGTAPATRIDASYTRLSGGLVKQNGYTRYWDSDASAPYRWLLYSQSGDEQSEIMLAPGR